MTKTVTVTQVIEVTVDPDQFTEDFMANFSQHFVPCATIDDHIKYIAESYARGVIQYSGDFLEGYGKLNQFGVKLARVATDTEID